MIDEMVPVANLPLPRKGDVWITKGGDRVHWLEDAKPGGLIMRTNFLVNGERIKRNQLLPKGFFRPARIIKAGQVDGAEGG
jgi:hypothetical protein